MIRVDLIMALLKSLETYVARLEGMRPKSLRELADDTTLYWAVIYGLQTSVQHVLDVGNHILAAQKLASPADYKEVIQFLGRNKILPSEFAQRIEGMAGFRNIVVHRYLSIDPALVWDALTDHLFDFTTFSDHIIGYLRREGYLAEEE